MGLKTPLCLLLTAVSLLRAADPERPPRDASREEIRAYRIAVRQARNAVRDSARRENNILFGFSPALRNTMKYQFNLALVYAFQIPKEKG